MLETEYEHLVLEMVASYGMAVGKSVFDTCVAVGRYSMIKPHVPYSLVYRMQVKMHLVGKTAVKDAQITQLLVNRFLTNEEIDRWGDYGKGTLKDKGMFHGFNNDIYQAYAVGVTWLDITNKGELDFEEITDKNKKEKRKKKWKQKNLLKGLKN